MGAVVAGGPTIGNVVCDLDGVVYLLGNPIPGAGKALIDLDRAGYSILFVTNNSTRTPVTTADRIAKLTGYPAGARQVIGSAEAAVTLLAPEAGPVLVVGGAGIRQALSAGGIFETDDPSAAAAVVVGLDTNISYHRLRDAVVAVRNGARFIATNTDATFPTPDGLWPGAGAMVAAIEVAAGTRPEIAGKPHSPIRKLIQERLEPGPVWVIGDRPETDLAMARLEGWTSVLVLTGVVSETGAVADEHSPDLVLASLADLPEALQA